MLANRGRSTMSDYVLNNPALPRVPIADLRTSNPRGMPEYELRGVNRPLYEHWVFNTLDDTSLVGRVYGRTLTVVGSSFSFNPGVPAVSLVGYGTYLLTDLADRNDWSLMAIVKEPSAGAILGGNWDTGHGSSIIVGASPSNEVLVTTAITGHGNDQFDLDLIPSPTAGDWMVVGVSHDYASFDDARILYGKSQSAIKTDPAAKVTGGSPIAIGNAYYNVSPYSTSTLTVAEAVLYDGRLSADDMALIARRLMARGGYNGIAVAA